MSSLSATSLSSLPDLTACSPVLCCPSLSSCTTACSQQQEAAIIFTALLVAMLDLLQPTVQVN